MKKITLLICISIASLSGLYAQASTQTIAQDSIKFEKIVHDYGTMVQGADGNSEFKFTNQGKAPLVLSNVQASCGCTVPEWPKEPILPGKTNSIKVKYNTSIVGNFNKSITINSNAVNNPVVLQVKGNVTAPTNTSTQTQKTVATAPKAAVSTSSVMNNPTAPTIENAKRLNSSQTSNTSSPNTGAKPRLNPPHGQPWHRCDIAVGSPLP